MRDTACDLGVPGIARCRNASSTWDVARGIAQALFEEMVYSDSGQPPTSTLLDYLAPSAPDLPDLSQT